MSETVISVEHLSKRYRLGVIGTGTLKDDVKVWFARARGKPNPLAKIDEADHGNREGDTLWALKDVNFTVQKGEALGIIGRNGAGKSTLLKILARVTTPTSGHVHVKGRIASLLEVGTGFHPELTGRENIFLNGAIMGMTRAEVARKFDEIVDFSGVEKFIDTPVKRYSSGMYVRLAFAVAAHLEPEILIVDEVLAVGDSEFQRKCLGKMGEVSGEGRTVLFVSHNMGSIIKLCPKSIHIDLGRIVDIGSSDLIIQNYLKHNDTEKKGEKIWKNSPDSASGDKNYIELQSIKLRRENGEVSANFFADEKIFVEISYELKKSLRKAWFGIKINLYDGDVLLTTGDHNYGDDYLQRKPGTYITKFIVPANYLNENNYTIGILAHIPGEKILINDDSIISFEVKRAKNVSEGRSPGLVLANFPYETKYIE